MRTKIYNSSLSRKFQNVTFTNSSLKFISKIFEKEFANSNCRVKCLELIQIAEKNNLPNSSFLKNIFFKKFNTLN